MKASAYIPLIIALVGISCTSKKESIVDPPPPAPVFTGLEITFEDGRSGGTWETPADQPKPTDGSTALELRAPAPNPFSSEIRIPIEMRDQGTVSIWMAREPRAGENGIRASSAVGSVPNADRLIIVDTLIDARQLVAGMHIWSWNGTIDGQPAPAGFYRIYVSRNGSVGWRDVYLSRTPDDMPEGLRGFRG